MILTKVMRLPVIKVLSIWNKKNKRLSFKVFV